MDVAEALVIGVILYNLTVELCSYPFLSFYLLTFFFFCFVLFVIISLVITEL